MSDLNIYQRMIEIKKNCTYAKKDKAVTVTTKKGGQFTYNAVTHDAVNAIIREHFNDHGVMVIPSIKGHTQQQQLSIVDMEFTFVNVDNPEDRFSLDWFAYGEDYGDKGPGKAASYAAKNMYIKILQIETGEDDESRVQSKPLKESDLLSIKEMVESLDLNDKTVTMVLKKIYKIDSLEKLQSNELPAFKYDIEKQAQIREKYRRALTEHAVSINAIRDGIENEDWEKAAEAWYELSNDERNSIWIAPTRAEALNLHAPFTTAQRDIIHDGKTHMEEHKLFTEALNKFYEDGK